MSGFDVLTQARMLASFFELMRKTRSRMNLAPEELDRLVRRSRYLAPTLPLEEKKRLIENLRAAQRF